ncbi:hypothetical protein KCMC57_64610 (plasmid) [Kitasatospora sp. CMC57]|uniref:ParB/Spo0J HTH domain-containing protein n=1 Tax=Kitasatospora sp. CMC57 TaxID=3231513 RepID=A0AB33K8W3_9ACTN
MTVAEQLGAGAFGGRSALSARGRAKAEAQGQIPGYGLVRFGLEVVGLSPLNPRRDFGTEEDRTVFGEDLRRAQLAACVAVSRAAYLKLWPEHELAIDNDLNGERRPRPVEVVLLNGERRYRSGLQVGLEALDFVVRDDLAATKQTFLENLLKENIARKDFDVIERAQGVAMMVDLCAVENPAAPKQAAAARFGKDPSWVTNQLALLRLPGEIQGMLSAGVMAERHGRVLARRLKTKPGLSASALADQWAEIKAQEAAERLEKRRAGGSQLSMDKSAPGVTTASGAAAADTATRAADTDPDLSMDKSQSTATTAAVPEVAPSRPVETASDLSMDKSEGLPQPGLVPAQAEREGGTDATAGAPASAVPVDWQDTEALAGRILEELGAAKAKELAHALLEKAPVTG